MLYTEPRVAAVRRPLGFFVDHDAQERADLRYGGQDARLRTLATRAPEKRPLDVIPAPVTPPSR